MDPIDFRVGPFPVRVQPSFFVTIAIALLFQIQGGGPLWTAFLWGGVVFVSVLVHELGHAAVARGLGVSVGTIELHMLGGHVPHARTTAGRSLAISLAGPLAGLSLGALVLGASVAVPLRGTAAVAVSYLLTVNIAWSIFNLLPMNPLDGGHALQSGLSLWMHPSKAWFWTSGLGMVLGTVLLAWGLSGGGTWIAFIGGAAAYSNYQIFQALPR